MTGDLVKARARGVFRVYPSHRGKKSLTLDPTRPRREQILHALLATAITFVTNVRQQSLERMG